ncbi:hypothetical protein [Enterococcus sp. AZ072]|uniref:hypothetical protein n=1 Tax=unclassified Enterococcus TaxID=2608891 RepID=UPI003D2BEF32
MTVSTEQLHQTIELLVQQYQLQDTQETMQALYTALQPEKRKLCRWLRRSTPAIITDADLDAVFDDTLLEAVSVWDATKGVTFLHYVRALLNNKRKNLIRKVNAKKRKAEVVSIEAVTEDSNALEDSTALATIEELEGSEVLQKLKEYSRRSKKAAVNAGLIRMDKLADWHKLEDKYSALRWYLQDKELSDTAIRKKVQRAVLDFRQFMTAGHA